MNRTGKEIVPNNSSGVILDPETLPKDAWRAILRRLNEKSQKSTQVFNNCYSITINDISQILQKIEGEFEHRTVISSSTSAHLILSNNRRVDFRTWKEFSEFDTSQPEKTRSISVQIVVHILNQETSSPETYSIEVSVQNNPAQFGIQIGPLGLRTLEGFGTPPAALVLQLYFNAYFAMCSGSGDLMLASPS